MAELAAHDVELFFDFCEGERLGFVCLRAEVAAGAGEVTLFHDVVGGSAADCGFPGDLVPRL